MTTHPDVKTIQALRQREETAYRLLYSAYYPMIERMVTRQHGTAADAQDVFQDTLVVLMRKLDDEHWQLTSSLKTYLYAIAHNLWLKRLASQQRTGPLDDATWPDPADDLPDNADAPAQRLPHWLERITMHCQRLIRLIFFEEKRPADIGYKNAHTAQNQQYKCLEQLRRVADKE